MPNWTAITLADLYDANAAAVIDAARNVSLGAGQTDPAPGIIAEAISRIRAAVGTGNALDVDPSKIPNSLKGLATRLAVRKLKIRVGYELSQDERDEAKSDDSYLLRISDAKIRFETPDVSAGSAEMQEGAQIEVASTTPRQMTRDRMKGL